jgi:hypothetical protein
MAWPRERDTDWARQSHATSPPDGTPRWPWPVNKWFIPAFWLVILFIACLAWFG